LDCLEIYKKIDTVNDGRSYVLIIEDEPAIADTLTYALFKPRV